MRRFLIAAGIALTVVALVALAASLWVFFTYCGIHPHAPC